MERWLDMFGFVSFVIFWLFILAMAVMSQFTQHG